MKRLIIIITFFMNVLVNSYGSEVLKNLNLQELNFRNIVGGIDYILNDKSPNDMIFYFKLYNREVSDNNHFYNGKKERAIKMFEEENLHNHYSQEYIKLRNGEKFLYGKIIALPSKIDTLKLELYFIDKNDVEKKKVIYKKIDTEEETMYSLLRKINSDNTEGASPALPYAEEIGIITKDKKIHKKINYYYRNFGNFRKEEIELYAYLLRVFEKEIPGEFFEVRKKYLDELMKD